MVDNLKLIDTGRVIKVSLSAIIRNGIENYIMVSVVMSFMMGAIKNVI